MWDVAEQLALQPVAFMLLVIVAALSCWAALAVAAKRGRYPHLGAWLLFVLWSALIAAVPAWRQADQESVWLYGLRGVPVGWVLGSMLSLGSGRREAADDGPDTAGE